MPKTVAAIYTYDYVYNVAWARQDTAILICLGIGMTNN